MTIESTIKGVLLQFPVPQWSLTRATLLSSVCLTLFAAFACRASGQDEKWGPELDNKTNTANITKSKNLAAVLKFLHEEKYKTWQHDPYIRPTGEIYRTPENALIDGSTHHRVRIYYSPSVAKWVKAGRPDDYVLPDRSMIVKEMYNTVPPRFPDRDPVIGWAAMVRKNGASHDGWYWVIDFKEEFRSMATVGQFSYSFCLTCHASTKSHNTFSALKNLTGANAASRDGSSIMNIAEPIFFKDDATAETGGNAGMTIDPMFERLYNSPEIYPYGPVPRYEPEATGPLMPSVNNDHVWSRVMPNDRSYLTSDNCSGCHDATDLVGTQVPNMLITEPIRNLDTQVESSELTNLSVYGEWRASPMGMAGRDPIFFAQLESEMKTYPEHSKMIQNTCLSCHGAMGQRQYQTDRYQHKGLGKFAAKDFQLDMVFQTGDDHYAKYGALARDGISCMVCHQMDPESLPTNTGKFKRGQWNKIYGSTAPGADPGGPIRPYPMQHALGLTPEFNPYVNKSETCGACHTIKLPVFEPDNRFHAKRPISADGEVMMSEAHEQDTYLEWFYSAYQNSNPDIPVNKSTARTCQDCHMAPTYKGSESKVNFRVANVENTSWPDPPAENLADAEKITVPHREDAGRHTLFGMNLFVLQMYRQFGIVPASMGGSGENIFGLQEDPNVPMGTEDSFDSAIANGEWQIQNSTATTEVLKVERAGKHLVAEVRVSNLAGHRLPSGVGFRRAWLEFAVTNAEGDRLWTSGATNSQGVIVGPEGEALESEFTGDWKKIQPHWEEISRQNQVQIYEERYVNEFDAGPRGDKKELRLSTSFLGIGKVVKDNRLQPLGYNSGYLRKELARSKRVGSMQQEEKWQSLLPESALPQQPGSSDPDTDPNYRNGSGADVVRYRIPLDSIPNATQVIVHLNYQNIPPYYLRDRFANSLGGEQTQRLYYVAGHLNTDRTSISDWKIRITSGAAPVPQQ